MMIIAQPFLEFVDQSTVTIRALSSITPAQADIVAQALQAGAPAWTVQASDDYDGYLSILVQPNAGHDNQAFFIAGTANRLELAKIQDDHMTPIASFTNAADLSAHMLNQIDHLR